MTPPRIALVVLSWLVMMGLTACGGDLLEPAAAVVHGTKIPVEKVQSAVEDFHTSPEFKRLAQQGDADAITREFEQSYLSQLIRRAVLTPEAEELGIEVSDEDLQTRVDAIKAEFPTENAFEEALREQGLTLSQLEFLVHDQILEEELRAEITADLAPTEQEIRTYYDENRAQFTETEAQHILVDKRSLAEDIARRLQRAARARIVDLFASLAKRHSTDTSNKNEGGDLGFFSPGDFVPAFEDAAAALQVGEVSDPVKSEFGWHVIRVTDRRRLPLAQVSEQIASQLGSAQDQAWDEWVTTAYRNAEIKVNPRFGEFNLDTQQVEDASARTIPGAEETPPIDVTPEGEQTP